MNLESIRRAHRTRLKGGTWKEVAEACSVSVPTARKMVEQYHERRKAGKLFEDKPGEDADWYRAPIYRNKPLSV